MVGMISSAGRTVTTEGATTVPGALMCCPCCSRATDRRSEQRQTICWLFSIPGGARFRVVLGVGLVKARTSGPPKRGETP